MSESAPPAPSSTVEAHEHLRVDSLRHNLRNNSTRSGALMIASNAIQLLLGVGGTAILARMLRPQDFGYLAMVATFTNFVATFRDFGLPMATVHKQELSHAQASGLFWINALASVAVAALVAATAPALAWFYSEPKLLAITLVMAGGVLLNALGMVHVGLMRRRMSFGAITVIEIGAVIVGILVGVSSALAGAGYWALVFQQIAIYAAQSTGAWVLCPWRPASRRASATLKDPELRVLLHYGKNVSAARLVSYVGKNMDAVLVGYFAGPRVLGLYQKAYQWSTMPFWQVYGPLLPVAVSSFSRLQGEPERYRSYVRTTLLGLFSATLPATVLLFLTAEPVILLILGRQWVDSIVFFQILCVGAFFGCFGFVTRWLYLSEGRTADQLRWAMVSALITIAGVIMGLKWGAVGVAMGFSAATAITAVPGIWYCLRRSPLRGGDFLLATWRPFIASFASAAMFMFIRQSIPAMSRPISQLLLDSAIYLALYAVCWLALPHGRAEAAKVLRHLRVLLPS